MPGFSAIVIFSLRNSKGVTLFLVFALLANTLRHEILAGRISS